MKSSNKRDPKNQPYVCLLILLLFTSQFSTLAQDIELSGEHWKAWQDINATWKNDQLYLPSEIKDIADLPTNMPTSGWGVLESVGRAVSVPLTIEEYFSNGDNTYTYEGVSWIWRNFEVKNGLKNKILILKVEKARMRAEIYINKKLAAYDIIGNTPFEFDVSEYVDEEKQNTIAVRLTNPGGRRGWLDAHTTAWGDHYNFPNSGINFTTLGHLRLEIKDKSYITDVFVKNLRPSQEKNLNISITINNTSSKTFKATIPIRISDKKTHQIILKQELDKSIQPGINTLSQNITLSDAELWSCEHPILYNLEVSLTSKNYTDTYNQIFGIRTFEVLKGKSGGHNYYLNGKRFFWKTAIDWGYYAPNGDYATEETAQRSVEAAKQMHHNGINFHRKAGEPLVMKYADELGACILEEPGGFQNVTPADTFQEKIILERIKRMVIRDRNHPSVIMYNLANEQHNWNSSREKGLRMINALNNSSLVTNSSGIPSDLTPHIRPYEDSIRSDFRDQHTAMNHGARYMEDDFSNPHHRLDTFEHCTYFLGEVISVTGPANWYRTYASHPKDYKHHPGYDARIYKENHDKTVKNFTSWRLDQFGSKNIKSPSDVSTQAGRGMMYIHGRHAQTIMCNNAAEGYALNGWTPGPQSEGNTKDWGSSILDEGRFLKGPPEKYTYWTRPLQVAINRKNGKYFNVGDTAIFELSLINQGKLPKGQYQLELSVSDSKETKENFKQARIIEVKGGECFAQRLKDLTLIMDRNWHAGYITLSATLTQNNKVYTDGSEQILLQNRMSYASELRNLRFKIYNWKAANDALDKYGIIDTLPTTDTSVKHINFIGDMSSQSSSQKQTLGRSDWYRVEKILDRVHNEGETLILKFDKNWSKILHMRGILSKEASEWGGTQSAHWLGNGWGYLDHFMSNTPQTIGTNAWEVPSDPYGFYPFESEYPLSVYGIYMARPWQCKTPPCGQRVRELQPSMLVLLGAIDYGKGKIILQPCYHIDNNNAFTDMLFYTIILKSTNEEW